MNIFKEKKQEDKNEREITYDKVCTKLLNKISKALDEDNFSLALDLAEIYSKVW